MNEKNYRLSEGIIDKYLEISNLVTVYGYTSDNINAMADLCYDAIVFISEMRCAHSQSIVRRRRARHERQRQILFNCK